MIDADYEYHMIEIKDADPLRRAEAFNDAVARHSGDRWTYDSATYPDDGSMWVKLRRPWAPA